MIRYKIYCLIDPRSQKVFYVGATKLSLSHRLSGHVSDSNLLRGGSTFNRRCDFIQEILKEGGRPVIKLLKTVLLDSVDHYESFYYRKFTRLGNDLLQCADKFNYSVIKR